MSPTRPAAPASPHNQVHLSGRVTSAPIERELPSGDRVLTFRVTMARERTAMTARSKQTSDWVDCAAWAGRARRAVSSWQVGDLVSVEGALRRRFYQAGEARTTRVEVEVLTGRRIERGG